MLPATDKNIRSDRKIPATVNGLSRPSEEVINLGSHRLIILTIELRHQARLLYCIHQRSSTVCHCMLKLPRTFLLQGFSCDSCVRW